MGMEKDDLGNRIKSYEACFKQKLPIRLPIILRADGKAFHTLTRSLDRPFDNKFIELMNNTAKYLCENIQGTKFAYVQSDEISLLLYPWSKTNSTSWFDNEINKMVSVSAALASSYFTFNSTKLFPNNSKMVQFDSRVFVLPEYEVNNYFEWRMQDFTRNSIQMLARQYYSHKDLLNKKNSDIHEMLRQKEINWNDLITSLKRGRGLIKTSVEINGVSRNKWVVDNELPIFHENKDYLNNLMKPIEEEDA
jgi:tRNA(His) 5'-end guanylyltransferase